MVGINDHQLNGDELLPFAKKNITNPTLWYNFGTNSQRFAIQPKDGNIVFCCIYCGECGVEDQTKKDCFAFGTHRNCNIIHRDKIIPEKLGKLLDGKLKGDQLLDIAQQNILNYEAWYNPGTKQQRLKVITADSDDVFSCYFCGKAGTENKNGEKPFDFKGHEDCSETYKRAITVRTLEELLEVAEKSLPNANSWYNRGTNRQELKTGPGNSDQIYSCHFCGKFGSENQNSKKSFKFNEHDNCH